MKKKTSKAIAMALAAIIAVGMAATSATAIAEGIASANATVSVEEIDTAAHGVLSTADIGGSASEAEISPAYVLEDVPFTVPSASELEAEELTSSVTEDTYDSGGQTARAVKVNKYIRSVSDKSIYSYTRLGVSLNGRYASVKGLVINGTEYLPYRAIADLIGASYSYDKASATSVLKVSGLTVSATSGNYVVYANDRVLFADTPTVIMSDGRMYVPAASLVKALGLSMSVSGGNIILSGSLKPITPASQYYREDEVFWLARIIHAESAGEPLLGKIAVGNVVLNRVASKEYPNTIYGVIFDRKYGVQFSPILNGSIYNTPSYMSRLAAMICLEGTNVTGGALFFLRPELSTSSWIPRTRTYAFTIGKHDFYY